MSSSIKSNVHCYCRLRREEGANGHLEVIGSDLVRLTHRLTHANSSFFFDRVYSSKSTQYDLFQEFEPLLNDILNGSRATIFNFGETSSGKTFTQYGTPTQPGLVYRLLEKLTDLSMRIVCRLKLSMVEVIENDAFDLCSPSYRRVRHLNGKPDLSLLTFLEVATPNDMLSHLEQGLKSRAQAHPTGDSHAHLVVSYFVEVQERKEIVKKGALTFVDLAGSEHINYSIPPNAVQTTLQALSAVIRSFDARDPVISTGLDSCSLLHLLNDSLQCNHQLIMIYNVDPSADHLSETQKTLQFHHESRKEYNYQHLIQFLEKENAQLYQQVTTLKLENGVFARQMSGSGVSGVNGGGSLSRLSVNTSGTAGGAPGTPSGHNRAQPLPKSPSNVPPRFGSMDRINPMTPTFVPNSASRRVNSVSIVPSLIPRSPMKGIGGEQGARTGFPTFFEIKNGLGRTPSSARRMKLEESIPEDEPLTARNARGAASKGVFAILHSGPSGRSAPAAAASSKRLVKGKPMQKKILSRATGASSSGRGVVKSSPSQALYSTALKSGVVRRPVGTGGSGSISSAAHRVVPRPGYVALAYQE